jgi:hypothetical protein
MSSGPSDARAESDMADQVMIKAMDLAKAIKSARIGHRGMAITKQSILEEVNGCLSETEFKLILRENSR